MVAADLAAGTLVEVLAAYTFIRLTVSAVYAPARVVPSNVRAFVDSFVQINAAIGVRLLDERLTLQVIGANVTDEEVQQHIFGDIISRKVTGQLGFRF